MEDTKQEAPQAHHEPHVEKKSFKERFYNFFFEKYYKKLLIIPILMLVAAFIIIGVQVANTGDFINRDISLKGGLTLTVPTTAAVNVPAFEKELQGMFSGKDIAVRTLKTGASFSGLIVDAEIDVNDKVGIDTLISEAGKALGHTLTQEEYSIEFIGGSLGASFFRETIIALVAAFISMGIVVFLIFRTTVPSLAVIVAAFSDIVVTLAVVDMIGLKISTAGIAAFLMLIGYSVDTDILLTSRVLKRKEHTVFENTVSAFRTGIMMTLTALVAITIAWIFTDSKVISEIMTILFIGLVADIINTWIQNVAIIRIYMDKKGKR